MTTHLVGAAQAAPVFASGLLALRIARVSREGEGWVYAIEARYPWGLMTRRCHRTFATERGALRAGRHAIRTLTLLHLEKADG